MVTRVMVLWHEPGITSGDEAQVWAQEEAQGLEAYGAIRSADVRRLCRVSQRLPHWYDWMLDLEVDAADILECDPLVDLIADLRLLGMRPAVLVPEEDGAAGV